MFLIRFTVFGNRFDMGLPLKKEMALRSNEINKNKMWYPEVLIVLIEKIGR